MADILTSLNLRRFSTLDIPMNQQAFATKLRQVAEQGGYNIFEQLSMTDKYLKGDVGLDSFELTRKRSFGYQGGMYGVVYKGTFSQRGEVTRVEIETRVKWVMLLLFLFPLFIFASFLAVPHSSDNLGGFELIFPAIICCIIIPIWYLSYRRLVASGEYMIQRELYFLSKKDEPSKLTSHLLTV